MTAQNKHVAWLTKVFLFLGLVIPVIIAEPSPCLLDLCCEVASKTCVTDPVDLGCFYVNKTNPFCKDVFPPWQPSRLGLRFELYTPEQRTTPQVIDFWNLDATISQLVMKPDYEFVALTHGFRDTTDTGWMVNARDALFDVVGNVNVLLCGWPKGATPGFDGIVYYEAASNTRMMELKGINLSKTTMSGHSLGGQVCGFVGKKLREMGTPLGRIISLDPAGPLFDSKNASDETPPETRVDPTDADFVQCIHTNGYDLIHLGPMGFGTTHAWGHVDVYANGGLLQPGCGIEDANCNHGRAHDLFVDFIRAHKDRDCPSIYPSWQCRDRDHWLSGGCVSDATVKKCSKIGYDLTDTDGCTGKYYFGTTSGFNSIWNVKYTGCQYNIALSIADDSYGGGSLDMRIEYDDGHTTTSEQTPLYPGDTRLCTGGGNTSFHGSFQKAVTGPCTLAQPIGVYLKYVHNVVCHPASVSTLPIRSFVIADANANRFVSTALFSLPTKQEVNVPLYKV